jgi:peroxiredoxin
MYPHERSLVKRLEGKPFVLLGVNSDSKERLHRAMKKENITWHSWWDGGGTDGPIAKAWNVKGWPTIYVLDPKGVIRHRDLRDKELDDAIDTLLNEVEAASK